MNDDLIAELTDLGERWRYEFADTQQMLDGKELLELLHRHGVPWPTARAKRIVSAPARGLGDDYLRKVTATRVLTREERTEIRELLDGEP